MNTHAAHIFGRRRGTLVRGMAPLLALGVPLLWTAHASAAEHSIIKHPGDHPDYSVEIEPHLLGALISPMAGDGFGLGARFSIPVMENGFIPTINNNAAIGFGVDWIHYGNCYRNWQHRYEWGYGCADANTFYFPVVLQWSFFLSTHFSAFGEAGVGFHYTDWGDDCFYYDSHGARYATGCGPGGHFNWDPFILMVGGRYHFSEKVALTGRIGYPYFSFGVSFYP